MRVNPVDVHVQHFDGTAVVTFHLGQFPAPTKKEPSTFSRRTVVFRVHSFPSAGRSAELGR